MIKILICSLSAALAGRKPIKVATMLARKVRRIMECSFIQVVGWPSLTAGDYPRPRQIRKALVEVQKK
jgi:hypothetical protein